MPSGAADGSILIETTLGTGQFEKGLKSLSQMAKPSMNDLTKQIEKVSSTMENVTKSAEKTADGFGSVQSEADKITLEKLVRDLDNTNARIENQQRLLDELRERYQRAVSLEGADSSKALVLEKQILQAEAALNRLMDKSDNTARKIWELDNAADDAAKAANNMAGATGDAADASEDLSKSANDAGDKVEDMGEDAEKAKEKLDDNKGSVSGLTLVLADLASKGIEVAIDAMKDLYDSAAELQAGMAMLSTNAQLAGIGTTELQDRLRDLNRVSDETDSNIEALSNLMYAGFEGESLAQIVEQLSGAVVAFPDTMKIESLADSIQETIATGEVTGQFAELLGRVGVDVDEFSTRMSKAGGETSRQQLILNTLARTDLPELSRAYQKNNADLIENRDAQFELDQAMLVIAEQVLPVLTQLITQASGVLQKHGDTIVEIISVASVFVDILLRIVDSFLGLHPAIQTAIVSLILGVKYFNKISGAVDGAVDLFFKIPSVLKSITPSMIKTAGTIMVVVAALIALAAIIAVIIGKSSELDSAMRSIGNSVGKISGQVNSAQHKIGGYASGTTNASSGPHWVGENGPELLWFNGGEAVITAAQSRTIAQNLQSGADSLRSVVALRQSAPALSRDSAHPLTPQQTPTSVTNYNFAQGSVAIDPKTIKDLDGFAQLLQRERNRRQDTQMGVSKRRLY